MINQFIASDFWLIIYLVYDLWLIVESLLISPYRCRPMARKSTAERNTRTNHGKSAERKSVHSFHSYAAIGSRVPFRLIFVPWDTGLWLHSETSHDALMCLSFSLSLFYVQWTIKIERHSTPHTRVRFAERSLTRTDRRIHDAVKNEQTRTNAIYER